MNGRTGVFLIAILACFGYVVICKTLILLIPNTERCKILDHTYVRNYTCKSKNVNRTLNLGSKEIIFQPGVSLSDYNMHVTLYRKFGLIYRQFMLDAKYDACAIRAGVKTSATQYQNVERRRKYGNFYDVCPMSGRRYEYNVPMDNLDALEIFPSGEYRVDTKAYTMVNGQRINLLLTQDYGEMKYVTAEQWRK